MLQWKCDIHAARQRKISLENKTLRRTCASSPETPALALPGGVRPWEWAPWIISASSASSAKNARCPAVAIHWPRQQAPVADVSTNRRRSPRSDVRFGFVSECEIPCSTLTPWGARRFRPRAATGGADPTGCVNIRRIPVRRGISSKRHVAAGFHVRSAPTDDAETA